MKKVLLVFLLGIFVLGAAGCAYLQHPRFGPDADAIRSDAVLASPNYVDGAFRNLEPTPLFTDGSGFFEVLVDNLSERKPADIRPDAPVPTEKTNLKALNPDQDLIVWLGHSSYFVQLGGLRFLIDPVFSTYAAPVPFSNKAFDGANPYDAGDMPSIDYLLITHEHWDHLDYDSLKALEPKVAHAVVGLGLGAYLKHWGYPADKVHEADWQEHVGAGAGVSIHVLPARHYSRRLMASNQTLWVGFAIVSDSRRMFFSGDSGYGSQFAEIGRVFGGFDLVALDAGQYNPRWAHIHMNPEEAVQAARDLQAKTLIPAHVGKFAISNHPWAEPFQRLVTASSNQAVRLVTPRIGEPLKFDSLPNELNEWWAE